MAYKLEAIHIGHHDIQKDEIRAGFMNYLQRFSAIGRCQHIKILTAQEIAEQHLDVFGIVDNKNFSFHQ